MKNHHQGLNTANEVIRAIVDLSAHAICTSANCRTRLWILMDETGSGCRLERERPELPYYGASGETWSAWFRSHGAHSCNASVNHVGC